MDFFLHSQVMLYGVFTLFVLAMLALDLGVFHRRDHVVGVRESFAWTAVWIALAFAFMAFIYYRYETVEPGRGTAAALEFLTGYLIEKSLSVDNIFVFLLIFSYFNVPPIYQHRVLFWGIIGALIFRAIFIALGALLIAKFHAIIYVFGAFLVITGIKMAWAKDKQLHPERNPVLRLFRKVMAVTSEYRGRHFFVREGGKWLATPLFVVLLLVESSDVIFAVDSIPAIFASMPIGTRRWRSCSCTRRGTSSMKGGLISATTSSWIGPDGSGKAARCDTDGISPAMVIWHLDSRRYRDDGRALAKSEAQVLIARAVAAEIQRLTADRTRACSAGQIAVLVRTNRQAALMHEQLSTAGVASVVYSTANVFDSAEARDLLAVLSSLAEPQSALKLKSALATPLLGVSAGDIAAGERSGHSWEPRIARHAEYLRHWIERGFLAMFRRFLSGEAVKQRLLGLPHGERRLTNVLHLAELAQAAAADGALGVAGLVQWLRRQIEPHAQRLEETQLRLESDEHAVKIVTVHRSKGLEYPVVFCPFAWSGSALSGRELFFHDPENDDRLTVDLSGERDSRHRIRAQNELLAENLRMLYVAVTRAQQRCYLAWGRINTAETSALSYLLRCSPPPESGLVETDWIARLKGEFRAIDDEELRRRLEALAAASRQAIAIRPVPAPAPAGAGADRPQPVLVCRTFHGRIESVGSLTSYSALASAAGADSPDHDAAFGFEADEVAAQESPSAAEIGILNFPAGARAGTFFHSILEALDFRAPLPRALVARKLKEFGFEPSWEEPVCRMLGDVLSVPMFDAAPVAPGRLAEVSMDRRASEMEFYFPLNLVTPARLEEVFTRCGVSAPAGAEAPLGTPSPRLHFAPTRGFMKGFIDLAFEHRGRYYLIDWKSNRLGAGFEAYRRCRLDGAMRAHLYDLQYHIYTLALHQYLRSRVPAYTYARHFGGVCYVFLRGVSSQRGPDYGLFCDRPPARRVHALGKALIPDYD